MPALQDAVAPHTGRSPFSSPGNWYRGNLHGHTTESDGAFTPAEYAAFYRGRGYHFAAVTDHWKVTDMSAFASADFAFVPGAELDGHDPTSGMHHVLGLGIPALPARSAADTLQGTVDAIRALGGLAFIAHPYWSGQSARDLMTAHGYTGIEVWNGTCAMRWGKGLASVQWDELLAFGRPVLALASDDAHHRVEQGDDVGLGWVVVRSETLSANAVLEALREGCFYASTGPEILAVRLERDAQAAAGSGALAHVRCSPCRAIHFLCQGPMGRTVNAAPGGTLTEATLRLHRAARYLRVECVDAGGKTAWTNALDPRAVAEA